MNSLLSLQLFCKSEVFSQQTFLKKVSKEILGKCKKRKGGREEGRGIQDDNVKIRRD